MHDAIRRLRALRLELETLHRTTAKVLAESKRLILELEQPALHPAPPKHTGRARRSAARARRVSAK